MTSPLISSLRLGPSFVFHRNLSNLLGENRKKRRGESVTVDPESARFPETDWDRHESCWTRPGVRRRGGRAGNRVHDLELDVLRNTREELWMKKQNKGSSLFHYGSLWVRLEYLRDPYLVPIVRIVCTPHILSDRCAITFSFI